MLVILLVITAFSQVSAEITGTPSIDCKSEGIRVRINMTAPFAGRIYLRGHSSTAGCYQDYSQKPSSYLEPVFHFDNCHPRRKREAAPLGMRMQTRMIVAHHPKVETFRDVAYDIDCFYRQQDEEVVTAAQELRVISNSPPLEMRMEPAPPQCTYRVELGNTTETPGETSATVFVGDIVTHVWSCDEGPSSYSMYCFKVHSCVARGEDHFIAVVDRNGCVTESELLSPLHSSSPHRTTALSRVFKFPNSTELYFDCQISFTLRIHGENGQCPVDSQELTILEDRLAFYSPTKTPDCHWASGPVIVVSSLFIVYFGLTVCIWLSPSRSQSWSLEA